MVAELDETGRLCIPSALAEDESHAAITLLTSEDFAPITGIAPCKRLILTFEGSQVALDDDTVHIGAVVGGAIRTVSFHTLVTVLRLVRQATARAAIMPPRPAPRRDKS